MEQPFRLGTPDAGPPSPGSPCSAGPSSPFQPPRKRRRSEGPRRRSPATHRCPRASSVLLGSVTGPRRRSLMKLPHYPTSPCQSSGSARPGPCFGDRRALGVTGAQPLCLSERDGVGGSERRGPGGRHEGCGALGPLSVTRCVVLENAAGVFVGRGAGGPAGQGQQRPCQDTISTVTRCEARAAWPPSGTARTPQASGVPSLPLPLRPKYP